MTTVCSSRLNGMTAAYMGVLMHASTSGCRISLTHLARPLHLNCLPACLTPPLQDYITALMGTINAPVVLASPPNITVKGLEGPPESSAGKGGSAPTKKHKHNSSSGGGAPPPAAPSTADGVPWQIPPHKAPFGELHGTARC